MQSRSRPGLLCERTEEAAGVALSFSWAQKAGCGPRLHSRVPTLPRLIKPTTAPLVMLPSCIDVTSDFHSFSLCSSRPYKQDQNRVQTSVLKQAFLERPERQCVRVYFCLVRRNLYGSSYLSKGYNHGKASSVSIHLQPRRETLYHLCKNG